MGTFCVQTLKISGESPSKIHCKKRHSFPHHSSQAPSFPHQFLLGLSKPVVADPGFARGRADHGEHAERELKRGSRAEPTTGFRGKAPGGGQGASPPEAENFLSIFFSYKKWPKVKDLIENLPPCLRQTASRTLSCGQWGGARSAHSWIRQCKRGRGAHLVKASDERVGWYTAVAAAAAVAPKRLVARYR